ncbi:LOW QUALITY PROTEIN: uncharacterized protein LOC108110432 [Drosophila eugracilis]|uniref:LOW QUALITY PROTEIN: uncharacterized protein LOC108110432 n=1 Tax=Drosophila eugracilis TaxID=29029 RepID=UPI001BD95849|nr:LOW QUALITY PROTEIN: uncharacterized protein LOC108110432 [Drosophila eugracilis]
MSEPRQNAAASDRKNSKDRKHSVPVRKSRRQFQCCVAREYYSEYSNLVDSLHIMPRMMVHQKGFKVNNTYGLTLNIKNTGVFPRLVNVTTDSPEDTSISIAELDLHRYLDTDETLEVKIWIRATSKRDINRRRHILIECYHPNIIFQVPIIVLDKLKFPSISDTVTFPSCVPGNKTHYEMIIYNPTKDLVRVRYRNTNRGLDINDNNKDLLPPRDYAKLLLIIHPQKLNVYRGFFNVKFGVLPPKPVMFVFTPKSMGVHLSVGSVAFGMTKFSREEVRTVTVCNESPHEVFVNGDFHSEPQATVTEPFALDKEDRLSNKLIDDAVSMHSVLLYDFEEQTSVQDVLIDANAVKHFDFTVPNRILAGVSEDIKLIFRPSYDAESPFPEDADPPYFQRTRVSFCFSDVEDCIESHNVILSGLIGGIEVEFHPKVIDFRKIYLGEEHCAQIKVLNSDDVPAKVVYTDCSEPDAAGIRITPVEGFVLEPCTRGIFNMSFYSLFPSRFTNTLRFKVENGGHYKITLKGTGQPVQLRTFPQLVEFGSIPMAVPQKRYMLLMNPLAVPITLQVKPTDDGEETPLVLNIRSSTEMLPITVRDPIKHLQQVHEDLQSQETIESKEVRLTITESEAMSFQSVKMSESTYSMEFEEEVMEPIPQMAAHLLTSLKKQKIFDKSETDRRVIQEAMLGLLNTKYFSVFTKHSNYIFMDWNAVPSDPREVFCDNEIIYLRPNTGRSITILLVPNKVGYFHRSLSVRICPAIPPPSLDSSDDHPIMKSLIKSEFLCSKLWFEYNCVVPDIVWSNLVDLSQRIIYAGEDYDFEMTFSNRSIIGAFIHYDVIPTDMSFRDGTWKFFVDGGVDITAQCAVTFRSLGSTRLSGLVKIVGANRPYAFHLFANVLPTEIRVNPSYVHQRLQVYEKSVVHFYIDNYTPTHTKLSMRLKDIEFQYLTLRGGSLAPTGQSTYTSLVSMFTDPDLYQNILYIDLQFDNVMMLPITFLVEGVPLYFEPDIRQGFYAGLLFTDTKEQFQDGIYQHRFPIRVINKGHRSYRILIIRLNTYGPGANTTSACSTNALTSRFDMEPKNIFMSPSCESQLDILASSYVEGHATGDFLLQVIDQKYPQRKHIIRVRASADFMDCQLLWNPKQVNFNYKRCEPLKERSYVETPLLVNPCSNPVHNVTLQVIGPFKIKEFYEDSYEKELQISLKSVERKDIFVILNRGALKQPFCRQLEGRINVMALGKQLKSLPLRVAVMVPDVVILQPDLVLFDRGKPYDSSINLVNQGCMPADFKWRRLETTEMYIGDEDDPEGIAAEILSELLRMLEYDFSCEDQPNMTKRYQECLCQFRRFQENGDFILEILEEVINEMDLRHRPLLFPPKDPLDDEEDRDQSSSSVVRETISDILNRLHIESSERWSDPSSEYCFASRYIYFYEKRGIVEAADLECKLYLPHIRRNREMRAVFELSLLGGRSQRFTVTLVNLPQKIKFHKDSIYMGVKPWYESYDTTVRVTNMTKYPLQLVVVEMKNPPPKEQPQEKRLVDGYCKMMTSDLMHLDPHGADQIRVKGILGFSESFRHTFGAMINNSDSNHFCLRGQGVLPMLEMTSSLPSTPLDALEVEEEYRMLQKIYHYEIFRSITEVDEESKPAGGEEKENQVEDYPSISEDFSMLSSSEEEMSSERKKLHDLQLFRMVHTYVMVNNNQELPHATVLRQLILAERYLKQLRSKPELYAVHQQVYQTYQKMHKAPGLRQPAMVKHFTVQPIPCQQHGFILDLGSLHRNTIRRFKIQLHFFGPGKLIAAARTAVRIPGLYVDFNVTDARHADKKFSFWAEKCTALEYFKDKYRNMFERLLDAEQDPKLKHAHSFDLDTLVKHQRDLAPKDRRLIEEYYNSLNPSVYPDHKHHFTLAKIFSGCLSNYSGVDVTMVGFFKPESRFYEKDQLVEDYLFIDLHMGPTLPVLLKGVLVS